MMVEQELIDFVRFSTIWGLDDEIVERAIEVRRLYKIKLPDAIIAATALVYNLTLVTRNTVDFKNISGLALVNPWEY